MTAIAASRLINFLANNKFQQQNNEVPSTIASGFSALEALPTTSNHTGESIRRVIVRP
jgi:hypothetical protein